MDSRKTILNKFVSRAWVPVLILVVAFVVWQIYRVMPVWLEQKVSGSLREESIVVTAFPVERIGWNQTIIGEGSLLFKDSSLSWDAIAVEYQLENLLRRQLNHLELQYPVLSFKLDPLMPATENPLFPAEAVAQDVTPDRIAPSQELMTQPDEPLTIILAETETGQPVLPEVPAVEQKSSWEMLQTMPLNSFAFHEGVLKFQLHEETQFAAAIRGQLEKQPFGVSGDMLLTSADLAMHVSVRAPALQQVVTLQSESAMPAGAVRNIGNQFIDLLENCDDYPRITSSGQLVMDLFAEQIGSEPFYGSAEASLDELSLILPGSGIELALDDLVMAGVYNEVSFDLEGGFEILFPIEENLKVEPFGLRFSIKDTNRATVETEIIEWEYSGISARCAVLGKMELDTYPYMGWGRVETAFSKFQFADVSVEPFSILVTPDQQNFHFELSPLGLKQSGTLWLEDITGNYDLSTKTGRGVFSWYGLFSEDLGTAELNVSVVDDITRYTYAFLDKQAANGIHGTLDEKGESYSLDVTGQLVVPWINTMASWFGYDSFKLGGKAPELKANLNWQYPFLTGTGNLMLDALDLSMTDGTKLQGISGAIDFVVMIMPRTIGKQTTHVQKLISDPIVLHDIEIVWELIHMQELVVHKFTARIGEGLVELEPFAFNPLKPDLQTSIKITHFDADLLRQWLNEERFSIEGTIAGQIPFGWTDGELVFGSATFDLETDADGGYLKFRDEQFLREKFAALGGIPVDLKERLLNALWNNGIRMDAMEVYLGPTDNQDEFSFRVAVNGETGNELLEFPIGGFVINNLISLEDLAVLLNMMAPIRIDPKLGTD